MTRIGQRTGSKGSTPIFSSSVRKRKKRNDLFDFWQARFCQSVRKQLKRKQMNARFVISWARLMKQMELG